MIARPLLLLTTLLMGPLSAHSQERGEQSATVDASPLEEVLVQATRSELAVLDVPVNVSVLSPTDVEEFAAKTVDEILRQLPGFNLLRAADSIAGAPVTSTVSLRGLGGTAASRVLVLLDGIPMHSPISSEVYWARIPKHQIERIEVVRGGGANSWGNLSLGGVINIVTKKPRKGGVDFTGILSNPQTTDVSLAASQVSDSWELSGEASYMDTEGYYSNPEEERGPLDEHVRKDYHTAFGKAAYRLTDEARMFFSSSLMDETRHGGTPKDVDTTEIWTLGTGLDIASHEGSRWRADVFYEEMEDRDVATRISGASETITRNRIQPTSSTGASLVWSRSLDGSHSVSAGMDYRWTDVSINDYQAYRNGTATELKITDASQDMGGVFIQDIWSIGSHWQLNGSLRYDYVTNEGSEQSVDLLTGERFAGDTFEKNSERTVNPNVGVRYRLNESVSFRAAAYKGFRAATIRELYRSNTTRNSVVVVNNPYLAPERLVGGEIGVDLTPSTRSLVRLTLFRNTVEDLIQNITRGVAGDQPAFVEPCGWLEPHETCSELNNVGEMQSTGAELETSYMAGRGWSFHLSYLYNNAEVTKDPENPQVVGKQVRQAPKQGWTFKVRNSNRWLDSSLIARYVGSRFEDDLNTLPVDDFLLFDVRFARDITSSTQVYLSVENLLDEEYQIRTTSAGTTEIGRPRFIGLGLSYRR